MAEKKLFDMGMSGIKCDNPECNYIAKDVPQSKFSEWVNKPCPCCGSNLLTEEDYKASIELMNKLKDVEDVMKEVYPELLVDADTPEDEMKVLSFTSSSDTKGNFTFTSDDTDAPIPSDPLLSLACGMLVDIVNVAESKVKELINLASEAGETFKEAWERADTSEENPVDSLLDIRNALKDIPDVPEIQPFKEWMTKRVDNIMQLIEDNS